MSSRPRAEKTASSETDISEAIDQSQRADWSAYAKAYDLLSQHNPEYLAIQQDFEKYLGTIETPRRIYDIGGGTGNYTEIAARVFPDSEVVLAEPDPGMIAAARAKLACYENVRFENTGLEHLEADGMADLIVCVHALYAMPGQEQRLADLHRVLRPGGLIYLVDLGRYMDVADWRRYLFASLRKERGLIGALKVIWDGREIAKQNTAIYEAQKKGVYWTHSEEEFASAATAAGFEILRQGTVYRGYSDLLVCRAKNNCIGGEIEQ